LNASFPVRDPPCQPARGEQAKRSNAPQRVRQAGKRSEAADQATREAGFAGRPGVAPQGQEAPADWGA